MKKQLIRVIGGIAVIVCCLAWNTGNASAVNMAKNKFKNNFDDDNSTTFIIDGTNVAIHPEKLNLIPALNNGDITIKGDGLKAWGHAPDYRLVNWEPMLYDGYAWQVYSIGYGDAFDFSGKRPDGKKRDGASIEVKFRNAADIIDNDTGKLTKCDLVMKISNIWQSSSERVNYGAGILFNDEDKLLNIGAFTYLYMSYNGSTAGGRAGNWFNVDVKLVYSSNGKTVGSGNKMLWVFDDIDVQDQITGFFPGGPGVHMYSDDRYMYAESVKLISGYDASTISVSKNSELGYIQYSDGVRFFNGVDSEDNTAKTRVAVVVDPSGFKFQWAGSGCSTAFIATESTLYEGWVEAYHNGKNETGNTVYVNGPKSNKVRIEHHIKRNNEGPATDTEKYYTTDVTHGTAVSKSASMSFAKKASHQVINDKIGYIDLPNPGDTVNVSQTLRYEKSNLNEKFNGKATGGLTLKRPYAYFTGELTGKLYDKENAADSDTVKATYTDNKDDGVRVDSPELSISGSGYTVSFFEKVFRKDTDTAGSAGGNVKVSWKAKSGSNEKTGTSTLSDSGNDGGSRVFRYSGKLNYGESVQICATFSVEQRVVSNGNTHSYEVCMTVKRPNKACEIDKSYTYGITGGENIGRIGVKNFTKDANSEYTWTSTAKNVFSLNGTTSVDIWARPLDNIQFKYEACAGAYYAIQTNWNVLKGYGTHYGPSGKLTKSDGTYRNNSAGSDGYLFKNSVTSSPYKNPNVAGELLAVSETPWGRWSTGKDGSSKPTGTTFLTDANHAEMRDSFGNAGYSPSNGYTGYKCDASTGRNGTYQISGKDNGCVLGFVDVGGTISQSLKWNHVVFRYANNTWSNNLSDPKSYRTYEATANVLVPYNYILKPYIENKNDNKVVYLGGKMTTKPGVAVLARPNNTVSGSAYATITKKTTYTYRTYYINDSGAEVNISTQTHDQRRFNKEGSLTTVNDPLSVNSVTIPDNGAIHVGNKVCTEISVFPADSHNDPTWLTTVNGAMRNTKQQSTLEDLKNDDKIFWGLREYGDSAKANATRKATACSTVAKRPTMSVESSNAYSATNFDTGLYEKKVGAVDGLFGSWSEYGVFGAVKTGTGSTKANTFASGAALGYHTGTTSGVSVNQDRTNGTNDVASPTNSNTCTFMTQTFINFVNQSCTSKQLTETIGSGTAIGPSSFSSRMKDRYNSLGKTAASSLPTRKYGSVNYTDLSGIDPKKYYADNDTKANSSIAIKATNAYINKIPSLDGLETKNRTIIYNISDTLIIDGNINNEQYDKNLKSLSDITGVVIFAKNVWFTKNAQYINAVIIAENQVNTCKYDASTTAAVSIPSLKSTMCNTLLYLDAPVVAKSVVLNRTAGAGNLNDSIKRAEIFNLNMSMYLWSFDQMSRYSQATTTYSRELPTRY